MNNKYNAGFAPIVLVIIIAAVIAIGGGTYYVATKNSSNVAVMTVTPTASASSQPTATATAQPATATPKPSVSKSPATSTTATPANTTVSYATLQAAYDSGKDLYCAGPLTASTGEREIFYLSNKKIRFEQHGFPTGKEGVGVAVSIYATGVGYYTFIVDETTSIGSYPSGSKYYNDFTAWLPTKSLANFTCKAQAVAAAKFVAPGN